MGYNESTEFVTGIWTTRDLTNAEQIAFTASVNVKTIHLSTVTAAVVIITDAAASPVELMRVNLAANTDKTLFLGAEFGGGLRFITAAGSGDTKVTVFYDRKGQYKLTDNT